MGAGVNTTTFNGSRIGKFQLILDQYLHTHSQGALWTSGRTPVTNLMVFNAAPPTVQHRRRRSARLFHPFAREEYSTLSAGAWPSYSLAIKCISITSNRCSEFANLFIQCYH